jgi:Phage integrase family.
MARGYCRQRGKNRWQLEVDLGSYIDPKTGEKKRNRKYKTIKAKNQKEAETKLAQFIAELTGGGYFEPEKINFVEFVQKEWLPKCGKERLSHTSLDVYIRLLENRILPAFQYLRLDQIKPKHIVDFLHNLREDGMRLDGKEGPLSDSSIEYHYRVLNNIFNFAVEMQFIKESPLKNVPAPKRRPKKVEVYTLEETQKLLECLNNEPLHWQIVIKLAVTTGMRRSELFGLEFKHFDYENRIVHVEQALTYTKDGGFQIHEIKKGNGEANKRDIVISEALIPDIKKLELLRKKERLAATKPLWRDGKYNFLLAHENGKPYNPSSIKNWWKRFIKRHNLKYINIHALRHTSATLLINQGVHAKIISERLGHADIQTTMNIYGHFLRQADEKATQKLDEALLLKTENRGS